MSCLTQPSSVEIKICDDIFIKSIDLKAKYSIIPQHSHTYDHVSMLAIGKVRVWAGDEYLGDFTAPYGVLIKKNIAHRFLTLSDHVLIYCIHNLHDAENVSIEQENSLRPEDFEYLERFREERV